MKKYLLLFVLLLVGGLTYAQSKMVRFTTNYGTILVKLYDETPRHRDMFLAEVRKGTYTKALFNRVINHFVIQGGILDDTILLKEKQHPELGAPRFAAEIQPGLFHKRGTLGAGRDDNPEKASYFNQLYFVTGKKYTAEQLAAIAQKKNRTIPAEQQAVYMNEGGLPSLDGDYTVFGEIVEGYAVVEKISAVATDKNDVPVKPVVFSVKVISK